MLHPFIDLPESKVIAFVVFVGLFTEQQYSIGHKVPRINLNV